MREAVVCIVALCAVLAALGYGLYTHLILYRLNGVLDAAGRGDFQQFQHGRSRLSRLEEKLGQVLAAGSLSRERLEADRKKVAQSMEDFFRQTQTPISSLKLYAGLLQEQPLSTRSRDLVRQLDGEIERMDFLIQSSLKLSQLETDAAKPKPQVHSLAELMREVEAVYAPKASEKDLSFSCVCPWELTACFDPKWTAEAIGIFVRNAIKSTSVGMVSLFAQQAEAFCRIDISDGGTGISESERTAIFQKDYQGKEAQKAEGARTGLHLAQQILSFQGGHVEVSSQPEEGTTFSVFLPRG